MNLFIVGDVHGCFHTFGELLKRWNPATEHLIQVGDLVDRGAHVPETVELAHRLNEQYPDTTTFLLGNHEDAMLRHFGPDGPYPSWLSWGGRSTAAQYRQRPALLARHLPWLAQRSGRWQTDHVLVSHAGIADSPDADAPNSPQGLLWARGPLRHLGQQLQVVGHTPQSAGEPVYDPTSHTLYIDTGAVFGHNLCGVRLSPAGQVLDVVLVPVDSRDLLNSSRFTHLTPRR